MPSHFDDLDVPHHVIDCCRPISDADVPDADVVIATWWETAEWVNSLSSSKGAKVYLLQHYENWGGPVERVDATWRMPMQKIVISRWLEGLARDKFGDDGTVLVPNSVDTQQFHAPPRGKQPVPTVGIMYSGIPFKGCDISLEAFRRAAAAIPNLRLLSFGASAPAPTMPLPAGTEYFVRPAQQELRNLYARCDAWLFGSRSEGFGLPILEAMACRTPVIGAPTGAAPELLSSGGGILLDSTDPDAMANAIIEVARVPNERWRAMSDEAHAVATRYTWDDATDLFEKALEKAVANRHGHASGYQSQPLQAPVV